MDECIGKVVRVDEKGGVGCILEDGVRGKERVFTLSDINGYGGERMKELVRFSRHGLVAGVLVRFSLDTWGSVKNIRPLTFRF
ncbi:MAG: hypothetical protein AAB727_01805 [Patescibacteria group bacterium]